VKKNLCEKIFFNWKVKFSQIKFHILQDKVEISVLVLKPIHQKVHIKTLTAFSSPVEKDV